MRIAATVSLAAALAAGPLLTVSCSDPGGSETRKREWRPERASVARHITQVHNFIIGTDEEAYLKVGRTEEGGRIAAEFRSDILKELGGEEALQILGFTAHPHEMSRHEYLFFLDALHAFLVLYHPQWDGGESPGSFSLSR